MEKQLYEKFCADMKELRLLKMEYQAKSKQAEKKSIFVGKIKPKVKRMFDDYLAKYDPAFTTSDSFYDIDVMFTSLRFIEIKIENELN